MTQMQKSELAAGVWLPDQWLELAKHMLGADLG